MRYTEQIKYSWGYHWGIFREVWDMFTLHNYHWLIVGLLFVLCVIPNLIILQTPGVGYFVNTPAPPSYPALPLDILTGYYFVGRSPPSLIAVINYHWGASSSFQSLTNVLCVLSAGLLLVAYLREGSPVRGREE